jgi:hypothetical protein
VTLRARWVTLRARWVTLRARWVTLRARWVTLRARWVAVQIAPFNLDFAVVNKELDFSHMRDHLRRIMRGESSLLSLNATNAFVSLVTTGGPRVLESQLDSKKDIERQLKLVCEEFIMAVTKLTVEPMLSFITKVGHSQLIFGCSLISPTREELPIDYTRSPPLSAPAI